MVTRKGMYGPVTVSWTSGYPRGLIPEFVHPGNITPAFGKYLSEYRQSYRISMAD